MLSMLQTANQQHYIPIVDAAIAILVNDSDVVRKGSFKLPPVRAIDVCTRSTIPTRGAPNCT